MWALSLALTALSLLLLVLNLSHPDVPVYSFGAENVLFSIGYSTVGAVIVPRMSAENPVGWLFCAIGLLCSDIYISPSNFPDEIMVYESGTSVIRARYETLHPT
jgi:hypothetical protein